MLWFTIRPMLTMLFARFEVHIGGHKLVGKAWGESIDVVDTQSWPLRSKVLRARKLKAAQYGTTGAGWRSALLMLRRLSWIPHACRNKRKTNGGIAPHGKMRVRQ